LLFQAGEDDGLLAAALERMGQHQVQVQSLEGRPASLEEVFAHYTGAA
jgi:hypothetical protein